jgi:hypothetical protein
MEKSRGHLEIPAKGMTTKRKPQRGSGSQSLVAILAPAEEGGAQPEIRISLTIAGIVQPINS